MFETYTVFFKMSEWIAATPLMACEPTMARWAMLIFFSWPSSTSDKERILSTLPGQRFDTTYKNGGGRKESEGVGEEGGGRVRE